MIKAVIFDMDGVLMDSEPTTAYAGVIALKQFGINAKESDFKDFIGMGEDRFVGGVAELYGKPYTTDMKAALYSVYLDIVEEKLYRFEGIADMLSTLKQRGYKLALASSADEIKVMANLKAARIDPGVFECLLTGNSVERKKPYPDIYLMACEGLELPPEECYVVEDAKSGIKAAVSAGCPCIGVKTSFDGETLLAHGVTHVIDKTVDLLKLCPEI